MPRDGAAVRADDPGPQQRRGVDHAVWLLEPTWANAEGLLHKLWGCAKDRGYPRDEKNLWGAFHSMFTRLRHGATIDAMPAPATSPSTDDEPLLKYFRSEHLTNERLRATSQPFCELAQQVVLTLPRSAERTVCLRKLLESKDAAVRAALP